MAFIRASFLLLVLFASMGASQAMAGAARLPITLDRPILRSLINHGFFTGPGGSAIALDENGGCQRIVLSGLDVSINAPSVRIETKTRIRMGTYVAGKCYAPVEWEGYFETEHVPYLENGGWTLRFRVDNSRIYDRNHESAMVSGLMYKIIKSRVEAYLGRITINLAPPVAGIKGALEPLFPPDRRETGRRLLESFRPGDVEVAAEAVRAYIAVEVEEPAAVAGEPAPLTEEEMEGVVSSWESWDSFLVFLIVTLAGEPLSSEEKQTILDTLLTARYGFTAGFSDRRLDRDFVREQFIDSWKSLAPIFRNRLGRNPSGSLLGYLAFFSASDALATLDRAGPSLGIEISRAGLIRMARLLRGEGPPALAYGTAVDSVLRGVLGLGGPLQTAPIPPPAPVSDGASLWRFIPFYMQPAWAADASPEGGRSLAEWIVTRQNFEDYLNRTLAALRRAETDVLRNTGLKGEYHEIFRKIVPATAWQESCFRQFKKRKGKIVYLRSYNGTSVGLMQINERVWRGMYDRDRLRWKIAYNAAAGCEIIDLYIRRYALRKMDPNAPHDEATLTGVVYAMYNGGPGQYRKFLKRAKTGKLYKSDRLFREKYEHVERGMINSVSGCLF